MLLKKENTEINLYDKQTLVRFSENQLLTLFQFCIFSQHFQVIMKIFHTLGQVHGTPLGFNFRQYANVYGNIIANGEYVKENILNKSSDDVFCNDSLSE